MNKKVKINFGFTTVELLVAVTILAVLAILVVTVINPIDLLKQGKDSNRVASLNAVNNALRFLTENEPGTFIGTSSVVYVSIPSAVSDCSNLGLPTLPSGWMYGCATSANLRKIDGTGWIPVNFNSLPAGSPISELPVDSKNSTSTRNYFTYVASGSSWELAFAPEAEKNKLGGANNLTIKDGGQKASLFEIGKDLSLLPLDYGDSSLVGYWDFEEATGTIVYDRSGNGRNGVFLSSPIWTAGCSKGSCLEFDNVDDGVSIPSFTFAGASDYTMMAWAKIKGSHKNYTGTIMSSGNWNSAHWALGISQSNTIFQTRKADGASSPTLSRTFSLNAWHFVALVRSGTSISFYVNGARIGGATITNGVLVSDATNMTIGRETYANGYFDFNGFIDEPRIYNRALSATEVQALYSAVR